MRMRQQNDARRNSANTGTGNNWLRVGVLSATMLAPLIARWNDLRTSDRAQSLRELAAARISDARDARDQAAVRLAPVRAAANARLEDALSVASARLDDARELASAKLDDMRVAAQPRIDDAIERLAQVRTPDALQNVLPFSLARKRAEEIQRQRQRRQRQTMLFWLAGVGVGLAAAGAAAFVLARRRMTAAIENEEEPMVELPAERNLATATVGKAPNMRNAYTGAGEAAEISVPVQTYAASDGAANGEARFVGNIHTMIFHDADDSEHLPAEDNRIYFSSEDEARQAGYHYAHEAENTSGQ
jgi:hypothetical protein